MPYPNVTAASALEVDVRPMGQGRAHVLPRSSEGVRGHRVDTSARSEAEVLSIRATLDHGGIMSPAVTNARTPVGVSTSQRYQEEEEGEHGVGGRVEGSRVEVGCGGCQKSWRYTSHERMRGSRLNLCCTPFSLPSTPLELLEGHAAVVFESAIFALMAQGLGDSTAPIMASSGLHLIL